MSASEVTAGDAGQHATAPAIIGLVCGALSSLLYTTTNVCLRGVVHVDPVWVSSVKALPTLVLLVPWIAFQLVRNKRIFSSWADVGWLVLTALAVQVFGNVVFQWSLAVLGLAISVPLLLGTMLVGGALAGRMVLGEAVGRQKVVAIAVLILAACVLSYGAQQSESPATGSTAETRPATGVVVLALLGNMSAGVTYAFLGTMMRRSMRAGMSLSSTLFVLSGVGTTLVGGWALTRIGWEGMLHTPPQDLALMTLAGLFNALAFLAMAKALQVVSVLYVQMLNASQAAMAAVAGWLLFAEPLTGSILCGLLLTAAGLTIAGLRKSRS